MKSSAGTYSEAASLLNKLLAPSDNKKLGYIRRNGTSLKSLVFGQIDGSTKHNKKRDEGDGVIRNTMACSKSTYATVCQTLQHLHYLNQIFDRNNGAFRRDILVKSKIRNVGLVCIQLFELLFSKYQRIRGGGAVKRCIMKHECELRQAVSEFMLASSGGTTCSNNDEPNSEKGGVESTAMDGQHGSSTLSTEVMGPRFHFPRYVRVNTMKTQTKDAAQILRNTLSVRTRSTRLQSTVSSANDKPQEAAGVYNMNNSENDDVKLLPLSVYADQHVPDLLVLPPNTDLHDHVLLKEGKIILQDKSSCFSALSLIRGACVEGSTPFFFGSNDDNNLQSSSNDSKCKNRSGNDILDACAAPGNKTTHLAALLDEEWRRITMSQNAGHDELIDVATSAASGSAVNDNVNKTRTTIFALDRNSKRVDILKRRINLIMGSYKATTSAKDGRSTEEDQNGGFHNLVRIQPLHQDFLKVDPSDKRFCNVRAILLDPSCSSSGIVNHPDRGFVFSEHERGSNFHDGTCTEAGKNENNTRLKSLSNLQITMLKHAMSFPQVDRIVYSTCSIHEMENENVVSTALHEHNGDHDCSRIDNNVDHRQWNIVAPQCLQGWSRRGREYANLTPNQSRCLIRCDGVEGDETNGFFVCYLERTSLRNGLACCPVSKKKVEVDCMPSEQNCNDSDRQKYGLPVYNGEFVSNTSCQPSYMQTSRSLNGTTTNLVASDHQKRPIATEEKCNTRAKRKKLLDDDAYNSRDRVGNTTEGVHTNANNRKKAKKLKWKLKQKQGKNERIRLQTKNKI